MLALAGGFGFSFSVIILPFADIGRQAWRIPFALGALTILLAPVIGRRLAETSRYEALAAHRSRPGPGARHPGPGLRAPLPPARRGGVPAQHLQRAVVAAHEQVPHRRAPVLEQRHRAVPHRDHRHPRAVRARARRPARRSARPATGRGDRADDRDRVADGVLPRWRRVDLGDGGHVDRRRERGRDRARHAGRRAVPRPRRAARRTVSSA